MKLELNLDNIKRLSKQKYDENWDFRIYLKGSDLTIRQIDRIVRRLYLQISSKIDCTKCANCCNEIQPSLNEKDIENLSSGLNLSINEFKSQYLTADKEEPKNFMFNKKPCPFLKNNLCSQYKYRPEDCKSYPHLHKNNFVFRLINVVTNCSICPIVFNLYEHLKLDLPPRN